MLMFDVDASAKDVVSSSSNFNCTKTHQLVNIVRLFDTFNRPDRWCSLLVLCSIRYRSSLKWFEISLFFVAVVRLIRWSETAFHSNLNLSTAVIVFITLSTMQYSWFVHSQWPKQERKKEKKTKKWWKRSEKQRETHEVHLIDVRSATVEMNGWKTAATAAKLQRAVNPNV